MSTENPFGITRDEILNLAAQKIIDQDIDGESLVGYAHKQINALIQKRFETGIKAKVDVFLKEEMERIVNTIITPVDIWGEKTGKPTTIRQVLTDRAKDFWEVKVDDKGNESQWSGTPRCERMLKQITTEEFTKAIKENTTTIAAGFKLALERNASEKIKEFIDGLIRVK